MSVLYSLALARPWSCYSAPSRPCSGLLLGGRRREGNHALRQDSQEHGRRQHGKRADVVGGDLGEDAAKGEGEEREQEEGGLVRRRSGRYKVCKLCKSKHDADRRPHYNMLAGCALFIDAHTVARG